MSNNKAKRTDGHFLYGALLTHMRDVAYNKYPKIARSIAAEDDRSHKRCEAEIMAKAQAKRDRKAKRGF